MWVVYPGEEREAPASGSQSRAVHDAVRVAGVLPPEAEDRVLPLLQDVGEVPVHVCLGTPPGVAPVAAEVALYLKQCREIGLEGHGSGGPAIEVTPRSRGGAVLGEPSGQPVG